jgi:ElaB/YqjD/DUF883 family membrane-anchored ribosome-binding protein
LEFEIPRLKDTEHMQSVETLVSDVEELLSYIAIVKTPEVDAVRDSLERSLREAKRELLTALPRPGPDSPPARRPIKLLTVHPWAAVAAAAFLGAVIGVSGMRRHRVR